MKQITEQKLEKYFNLTSKALALAKQNIIKGKEADAKHFEDKGDFVNAFGALNYAHGWLDCGARLKIFDVDDDELFTVC